MMQGHHTYEDIVKKSVFALIVLFLSTGIANAIDAEYPINTNNLNVRYLYEQYQVMLEEVDKSISKSSVGMLPQDGDRWISYIANMRQYVAYWQSKSFLDWPVTHGRNYLLDNPLPVECDHTDNQASCDLMTLVVNARDELVVSSSAEDIPMHLHPADLNRQESYWQAMEDFITTFMAGNVKTDEPIRAAEKRLGLDPGFNLEPDLN